MTEKEEKEIRRLNNTLKGRNKNGCLYSVGQLIPEENNKCRFALFKLVPGETDGHVCYDKQIMVKTGDVESLKIQVEILINSMK